jgi:hypothetical protein
VIKLTVLPTPFRVLSTHLQVGAGASWGDVVTAAAAQGFRPKGATTTKVRPHAAWPNVFAFLLFR